jgi:hypothetical protein
MKKDRRSILETIFSIFVVNYDYTTLMKDFFSQDQIKKDFTEFFEGSKKFSKNLNEEYIKKLFSFTITNSSIEE